MRSQSGESPGMEFRSASVMEANVVANALKEAEVSLFRLEELLGGLRRQAVVLAPQAGPGTGISFSFQRTCVSRLRRFSACFRCRSKNPPNAWI